MSRDRDGRHSRRFVLKTGAGGALGGLLAASGNVAGEESRNLKRNVYESLGIKVPRKYASLSSSEVQPMGSSEEE